MASKDWMKEWNKSGRPTDNKEIVACMERAGLSRDEIAEALEQWMNDNEPSTNDTSKKEMTLHDLVEKLNKDGFDAVKAACDGLSEENRKKLIDQVKELAEKQKESEKEEIIKITAENRPYRLKIEDSTKFYQILDKKWTQVEVFPNKTMKKISLAKPFLIGTLDTLKKKVDTQRASGNLTDWKINVRTPILEAMKPFLKK